MEVKRSDAQTSVWLLCETYYEPSPNWLAQCQYTVTRWDRKFDQELLFQCGSM